MSSSATSESSAPSGSIADSGGSVTMWISLAIVAVAALIFFLKRKK